MSILPLNRLRVLDLGMYWAGPMAGRLLADFGAEVIKIESISYMDPWRGDLARPTGDNLRHYPTGADLERPYNYRVGFTLQNRNKYGITLALNTPQGKDIFQRLVKISDVVIENYTPRVMANFGLDYPDLKKINPQIILASLPAMGSTGPYKDYVAYGSTIDCLSGMAYVTGYIGEEPMVQSGMAYGDPLSGMTAAFAILAALQNRLKTGEGTHIELSQVEALAGFNSNAIMDYTMNGRIQGRMGNRDPMMAPHGCYRCRGDDAWVVIAIDSNAAWQRFCEAIGQPSWASDTRFADTAGRIQHQDELDRLIEAWTIEHDHYEVMRILQQADIPAGPVLNSRELVEEPQLNARGFYEEMAHPEAGTHPYVGMYAKFSKTPGSIRMPSPCLGEHNRDILGSLLGMSDEEIAGLEEEGIIGTVPLRSR